MSQKGRSRPTLNRLVTKEGFRNKTINTWYSFKFTKLYFLGKIISSFSQHFIWQPFFISFFFRETTALSLFWGKGWGSTWAKLAKLCKLSCFRHNLCKALFSCSSSAGRRCCRVCGSIAPRCPVSPSSPSDPWRRTRPLRYRRLSLPRLSLEEGNLTRVRIENESPITLIFDRRFSLWLFQVGSLTQQRVHVSLWVVEEAPVPADQVEGVHQVGPAQVLRRGHGLGPRQWDDE